MSRPIAAALALALGACALNNQLTDGGPGNLDFDIGGIRLRVASGTGRVSASVLGLYLTDQPDACLAITQIPVGAAVIFSLRVAPRTDGAKMATVIPGGGTPGPGQATGGITAQTGGVPTAYHGAVDGTVSWTANGDGSYTIVAIDVGFDGSTQRLQVGGWTVPSCP
ncbi:MAG TPA: hypothetical protein VKE22_22635 [Haliangiales bacterium]|nr:hypothetical protein [Haliangiales bacterium]